VLHQAPSLRTIKIFNLIDSFQIMLIKITWHQSRQLSVRNNLDADIPMENQTLYKENLSEHP